MTKTFETHEVSIRGAVDLLERVMRDAEADGFNITVEAVNPSNTNSPHFIYVRMGKRLT